MTYPTDYPERSAEVLALAERIRKMTPADHLRFAADLMEQGGTQQRRASYAKIAHSMIERVGAELGAALRLSQEITE